MIFVWVFIGGMVFWFLLRPFLAAMGDAAVRTNISRQLQLSNAQAVCMSKFEDLRAAELGRRLKRIELLACGTVASFVPEEMAIGVQDGTISPPLALACARKALDMARQQYPTTGK